MPATIHCIRHAQGFHNLGVEYHSLQDPRLTPLGEEQCAKLQSASFPPSTQRRISLITASPLTRTLHTAYATFRPLLSANDPEHVTSNNAPEAFVAKPTILALPDAQETSNFPCDTGSDIPVLEETIAKDAWPVDLSLLNPDWNQKGFGTRYAPHSTALQARARDTRILLREKARELIAQGIENPEIVLVSHGGYLHYFTGDWEDASKGLGTGWVNCETRAYEFEVGTEADAAKNDPDAKLVEKLESRARRGKEGPQAGWDKQEELYELAMRGWEANGLQRPDKLGQGWESGASDSHKAKENVGPGGRQLESEEANKAELLERSQGIKVQA